jgi:hypothetical protein
MKDTVDKSKKTEADIPVASGALLPPEVTQTVPDKDLLWKQYQLEVDLYKFYLEMTLKFSTFYYVATGAIVSFYFSRTDVSLIRYSLLFPILMSIGFGAIYLYGAVLLRILRQDIFDIRDKLDLDTAPDTNILGALLIVSAILMFFVAGVLAWLFFTR